MAQQLSQVRQVNDPRARGVRKVFKERLEGLWGGEVLAGGQERLLEGLEEALGRGVETRWVWGHRRRRNGAAETVGTPEDSQGRG